MAKLPESNRPGVPVTLQPCNPVIKKIAAPMWGDYPLRRIMQTSKPSSIKPLPARHPQLNALGRNWAELIL